MTPDFSTATTNDGAIRVRAEVFIYDKLRLELTLAALHSLPARPFSAAR
jgi:hypothetical protein